MKGHKCIVHGCTNHENEGGFNGDICSPCYKMITTGDIGPTNSFLSYYLTCEHFVYFVANDYIELSHDKTQWQRDDWSKRARKIVNEQYL